MKQKLENFATSYIETIAAKHKRNVEWAKSAVRVSASISAETALHTNVIDLIAKDMRTCWRNSMAGKSRARHSKPPARSRGYRDVAARTGLSNDLAAGGDVRADAGRHLRHHRRTEQSRRDLAGRVGAIALVVVLYMAAILPSTSPASRSLRWRLDCFSSTRSRRHTAC